MTICNCNQGRRPCTCQPAPVVPDGWKSIVLYASQLADMVLNGAAPHTAQRTASALLSMLTAAPAQGQKVAADRYDSRDYCVALEQERDYLKQRLEAADEWATLASEQLKERDTALAELAALKAQQVDERIPCDVILPPATKIKRGCSFNTLLVAMKQREKLPPAQRVFTDDALKAQQAEQEPATVYSLLVKGMADALRHALKELDGETPEDIDYGQLYAALHAYEQFAPTLQPDAGGLVEALTDAAQSLETISNGAGRDEFMSDFDDVRGYARSRASVARAALAARDKQSGGSDV